MEKELHTSYNLLAEEKTSGADVSLKRWFCVAIYPNGSLFNEEADSPEHFLGVLHDAMLAWIDFRTSNFEKDAHLAGTLLGFSDQHKPAIPFVSLAFPSASRFH